MSTDDRRRVALTLSQAAQALPPAERREFRKFLFGLDGAEAPRRKVHSWKRKKKTAAAKPKRARRPKPNRQLDLPLD